MKKSIYDALSKCKLFYSLSENDINYITQNYAEISTCEKKSIIFSETNYIRAIVIVTKGRATVTKNGGNGKILMSILTAGDIFGMAGLFYEKDMFLTEITAIEKVEMLTISKENLLKIFEKFPIVSENYITILSEKIHFLNKKISTYTKPEAIGKVASFILQYADENNKISLLPYSITRVSETLNSGRASVYRAFDELEKNQIIKKSGKVIDILDYDRLKNI